MYEIQLFCVSCNLHLCCSNVRKSERRTRYLTCSFRCSILRIYFASWIKLQGPRHLCTNHPLSPPLVATYPGRLVLTSIRISILPSFFSRAILGYSTQTSSPMTLFTTNPALSNESEISSSLDSHVLEERLCLLSLLRAKRVQLPCKTQHIPEGMHSTQYVNGGLELRLPIPVASEFSQEPCPFFNCPPALPRHVHHELQSRDQQMVPGGCLA